MKNSQKGSVIIVALIVFIVAVAGIGGWIANIVKLTEMTFDPLTGMIVARIAGIIIPPLGAVMGYL